MTTEQHNTEIQQNLQYWHQKPILQTLYAGFYNTIKQHINFDTEGLIVELGSGIGNLKSVVPQCICTDLFANPWIDRVENAYKLSFADNTVSNIILFDVWHHLEYPAIALGEFERVLVHGGRLIIFEPAMSLLGALVYGLFHHEPTACFAPINWTKDKSVLNSETYYAAQGNASRVFWSTKYARHLKQWTLVHRQRFSALAYIASGGYSGKQLYPDKYYSHIKRLESFTDFFPLLFASRLIVVLQTRIEVL